MNNERVRAAVESAISLFTSIIGNKQWAKRRAAILRHIDRIYSSVNVVPKVRVTCEKDKFGWYLSLAEMYVSGDRRYDLMQGARIIPFFVSIGEFVDVFDSIPGGYKRIQKLVSSKNDNPDSGIFELLTAILYVRNNYKSVRFIEEGKGKTPDLVVNNGFDDLYVECKRLSKVSDFSLAEREKWMLLWRPLGKYIRENKIPVFLKIAFHCPLVEYDDDYLYNLMSYKLNLISYDSAVTLVDDERVFIQSCPIDMDRICSHFRQYSVKKNSPFLIRLITGEYSPFGNYRLILGAREDPDDSMLLYEVDFAAAASWSCDSSVSIDRKSRNIKSNLIKAIKQAPQGVSMQFILVSRLLKATK